MNSPILPRHLLRKLLPLKSLGKLALAAACGFAALQAASADELYANSKADFSGEQGKNSWRYHLWNPETGQNHELPMWQEETKQWKEGDGAIWAEGMHPHSSKWYVVREWTAPAGGAVVISGSAELFNEADGVTLRILSGYDLDKELWTTNLASNQSAEFSIKTMVKKGDVLLFAIVGKEGIRNDATAWIIEIQQAP